MTSIRFADLETMPGRHEFCEGDNVVLAEGSYQGTPGVFLKLKDDVNWADIRERNGTIRSHPVIWLAHAPRAVADFERRQA
jgi:hypothetical protein